MQNEYNTENQPKGQVDSASQPLPQGSDNQQQEQQPQPPAAGTQGQQVANQESQEASNQGAGSAKWTDSQKATKEDGKELSSKSSLSKKRNLKDLEEEKRQQQEQFRTDFLQGVLQSYTLFSGKVSLVESTLENEFRFADAICYGSNKDVEFSLTDGSGTARAVRKFIQLNGEGPVDHANAVRQAYNSELKGKGRETCVPAGRAFTTRLKTAGKTIIHTVGPDMRVEAEKQNGVELLRNALTETLNQAKGSTVLSMPPISCGVFGFDPTEASKIMWEVLLSFFANNKSNLHCKLKHIRIVCFKEKDSESQFKDVIIPVWNEKVPATHQWTKQCDLRPVDLINLDSSAYLDSQAQPYKRMLRRRLNSSQPEESKSRNSKNSKQSKQSKNSKSEAAELEPPADLELPAQLNQVPADLELPAQLNQVPADLELPAQLNQLPADLEPPAQLNQPKPVVETMQIQTGEAELGSHKNDLEDLEQYLDSRSNAKAVQKAVLENELDEFLQQVKVERQQFEDKIALKQGELESIKAQNTVKAIRNKVREQLGTELKAHMDGLNESQDHNLSQEEENFTKERKPQIEAEVKEQAEEAVTKAENDLQAEDDQKETWEKQVKLAKKEKDQAIRDAGQTTTKFSQLLDKVKETPIPRDALLERTLLYQKSRGEDAVPEEEGFRLRDDKGNTTLYKIPALQHVLAEGLLSRASKLKEKFDDVEVAYKELVSRAKVFDREEMPRVAVIAIDALEEDVRRQRIINTIPSAYPKNAVWELIKALFKFYQTKATRKNREVCAAHSAFMTKYQKMNQMTATMPSKQAPNMTLEEYGQKCGVEMVFLCRLAYRLGGVAVFYKLFQSLPPKVLTTDAHIVKQRIEAFMEAAQIQASDLLVTKVVHYVCKQLKVLFEMKIFTVKSCQDPKGNHVAKMLRGGKQSPTFEKKEPQAQPSVLNLVRIFVGDWIFCCVCFTVVKGNIADHMKIEHFKPTKKNRESDAAKWKAEPGNYCIVENSNSKNPTYHCVMCEFQCAGKHEQMLEHLEDETAHEKRALLVFGFLYYIDHDSFEEELQAFYQEAGEMELNKEVFEISNARDTEMLAEVDIQSENFEDVEGDEPTDPKEIECQKSPIVALLSCADETFEDNPDLANIVQQFNCEDSEQAQSRIDSLMYAFTWSVAKSLNGSTNPRSIFFGGYFSIHYHENEQGKRLIEASRIRLKNCLVTARALREVNGSRLRYALYLLEKTTGEDKRFILVRTDLTTLRTDVYDSESSQRITQGLFDPLHELLNDLVIRVIKKKDPTPVVRVVNFAIINQHTNTPQNNAALTMLNVLLLAGFRDYLCPRLGQKCGFRRHWMYSPLYEAGKPEFTNRMLKLGYLLAIKFDKFFGCSIFGEDDVVNRSAAFHSTFQQLLDKNQLCYHSDMSFSERFVKTTYDDQANVLRALGGVQFAEVDQEMEAQLNVTYKNNRKDQKALYKAIVGALLAEQPDDMTYKQRMEMFTNQDSVISELVQEAKTRNPQRQGVSLKRFKPVLVQPPPIIARVVTSFERIKCLEGFSEFQSFLPEKGPAALEAKEFDEYFKKQVELTHPMLTFLEKFVVDDVKPKDEDTLFDELLSRLEKSYTFDCQSPWYGGNPNLYVLLQENKPEFRVHLVVVNPSQRRAWMQIAENLSCESGDECDQFNNGKETFRLAVKLIQRCVNFFNLDKMEYQSFNEMRVKDSQEIAQWNAKVVALLPFHLKSNGFHEEPKQDLLREHCLEFVRFLLKNKDVSLLNILSQATYESQQREAGTYRIVKNAFLHNFQENEIYRGQEQRTPKTGFNLLASAYRNVTLGTQVLHQTTKYGLFLSMNSHLNQALRSGMVSEDLTVTEQTGTSPEQLVVPQRQQQAPSVTSTELVQLALEHAKKERDNKNSAAKSATIIQETNCGTHDTEAKE